MTNSLTTPNLIILPKLIHKTLSPARLDSVRLSHFVLLFCSVRIALFLLLCGCDSAERLLEFESSFKCLVKNLHAVNARHHNGSRQIHGIVQALDRADRITSKNI